MTRPNDLKMVNTSNMKMLLFLQYLFHDNEINKLQVFTDQLRNFV